MFGDLHIEQQDRFVAKVDFQIQESSHYRSANSNQVVVIDTPLARVYLNENSYFNSVPESAWNTSFTGELSPKEFIEEKINTEINDRDASEFKKLLTDLIDAEFKSKSSQ